MKEENELNLDFKDAYLEAMDVIEGQEKEIKKIREKISFWCQECCGCEECSEECPLFKYYIDEDYNLHGVLED